MNDSSRRAFLKALGLGAASLAACERIPVRHAMPFLVPPEEVTPGVPTFYASTCSGCAAACGTKVKVLAGRPVKLEGNKDHPLSRGGLCAIGQAELRSLYDPSRLRGPMMEGSPVSWSELDEFVRGHLAALEEGATVRVLSSTLVSPSAREAIAAFLEPYEGRLVEHDLDPERPSAALEAHEILFGEPRVPSPRLEDIDVLVSLASDLFGTGADPVVHTRQWAERRRESGWRGSPRHVQIEGSLSLTGAAADERWHATKWERRALALWILRLVAERAERSELLESDALENLPEPPVEAERLSRLADALVRRRGRGIVVSGDNDLDTQLAVALTNHVLGAPLDFLRPSGDDRELQALVEELASGSVDALFVLGLDVVRKLPTLADAIRQVPLSVAIGPRANDTTAACNVVAGAHHGLECWHDMEPRPGLVTLAQPTVRPLFGTRHPHENFLHWSGAAETDWRHYLEEAWRRFDAPWTEMVRTAGLYSRRVAPPTLFERNLEGALQRIGSGTAPQSEGELTVELATEIGLREPSHAQNPWLRELPDPITRTAWVGTIRIAPELAEGRGIVDGDILHVQTDDQSVAMPARIVPGQDPRVLGIPLGYAQNAYALAGLASGRMEFVRPARVERTGRHVRLPLVQAHADAEERPIIHQVTDAHEEVHAPHHPDASLWPEHEVTSPHWEMVIDLDACTGCSACVVACQAENNIPVVGEEEVALHRDMHWLRMDRYYLGPEDNPDVVFEPMLCAQCDDAPCETVCPVAATVHSEDGLNQQVYNRCVGTRYCANNCPYKVRRFNWFDQEPADPIERLVLNPDVVVRSRGVMEKCTFCVQRIQSARIAAKRTGLERFQVETACQESCPARAIHFGDGTDTTSDVSELSHKPRAFQVLAELGIEPSVFYLARIRNRGSS